MLKKILVLALVALVSLKANGATLSKEKTNQIANAIYKLENSTKYPYGIKSIKTKNPRQICINTILNNFGRWQNTNKSIDFLTYLGNSYCPPKCDRKGNKNWIKNIHALVK